METYNSTCPTPGIVNCFGMNESFFQILINAVANENYGSNNDELSDIEELKVASQEVIEELHNGLQNLQVCPISLLYTQFPLKTQDRNPLIPVGHVVSNSTISVIFLRIKSKLELKEKNRRISKHVKVLPWEKLH